MNDRSITRRDFVRSTTAAVAAPAVLAPMASAFTPRPALGTLRFADRAESSLRRLQDSGEEVADKLAVSPGDVHVGFDSYKKVIDSGVDVVILTTPPAFRPAQLEYAIARGCHVFCEKPMAVDAPGVRSILASAAEAKRKNLSLVSGFCWRYSTADRATFKMVHDGAIGDLRAVYTIYNTGPLGTHPRQPGWTDMEWQMRNWHHFTWLSGDHIVEQACHSIDKLAWAFNGVLPERATAVGGRIAREGPETGNVYDHFSITYDFPNGAKGFHMCRQIPNCSNANTDDLLGTKGICAINSWNKLDAWPPTRARRSPGSRRWRPRSVSCPRSSRGARSRRRPSPSRGARSSSKEPRSEEPPMTDDCTRRDFIKASTATALASAAAAPLAARTMQAGSDRIRVGLIGCGGRGTGAAVNALDASERTTIVALADAFSDRLQGCRDHLVSRGERGTVANDRCYVGFDAYERLVESDVDMVILATPPHFRPMHFEAAVNAGRHVFMEKPVAVDSIGVRTVIAAAEEADRRKLSVVAGTQRRHEACYLNAMRHVADGRIGRILSARCYWNQGGLWMKEPRSDWSDMEWQMRNWLYFTWLSGDHICEQHIHNLDVCNWAIGAHPVRALGMGGREVRTDPNYGNIFDHFTIEYEYPDGVFMTSMCRQIDGCASRVEEQFSGTNGQLVTRPGYAVITGEQPWRYEEKNPNPYVQEHIDLIASISGEGARLNEGRRVAESTLTAIMGRMSAYTGKEVTWEQAMGSTLDLSPDAYEFGSLAVRPVAVPGRTPLV
jgi:predicted dehydrogenase